MFRKSVEKVKFSSKYVKNNGHLTWGRKYIYEKVSLNFLTMRNISTKVIEKIKTHILCVSSKLFLEYHAAVEIMWENMVEPDGIQKTTRRMLFAC